MTTSQSISTSQSAFHAMRGHVADGTKIAMRDGSIWSLHAVMAGWQLRRANGSVVLTSANAYDIEHAVASA